MSDGTTGDEPETAGPEKLLAEALRAQAVRARLPDPAARAAEPEPPLLSGSADGLLAGHTPDEFEPPTSAMPIRSSWPPVRDSPPTSAIPVGGRRQAGRGSRATTQLDQRPAPLPLGWIVLLAVLLGLAAGAVVGLVSVV